MTKRTYAQNARQRRRTRSGQYEKMNECDLCGKPLGEDYFSDLRVDSDVTMPDGSIYHWGDMGICLCAKCCKKLNKMSDLEAYEALTGEPYPLAIDYSADDGSGNRQPDDITPDPAGDAVAPEPKTDWELVYHEITDLRTSLRDYETWLREHKLPFLLFDWEYELMLQQGDALGNRYK